MTARTEFALAWQQDPSRTVRCDEALALSAAQTAVDAMRPTNMNTEAISSGPPPGPPSGPPWTTERIEQLRSCVTAGLTCSQIAAEIGVTRNAVIGKLHRLGLTTGGRPGRPPSALAQRMRTASPVQSRERRQTRLTRIFRAIADAGPTLVPFPAEIEVPVESTHRCSLFDLTSDRCRWPLSDPGKDDFGFCGNHTIAGISYCAGHARLAYRLPSGRRA